MNPKNLISKSRSGVVQILLERDRELIGFGSGFLVEGGLLTNSHNIRSHEIDAVAIRFENANPDDPFDIIRIAPDDCAVAESPESDKDYVYLKLSEPEFDNRHIFSFNDDSEILSVGEQVVFLGFPFGMRQLTAHIGYVSSIHMRNDIEVIQIDGSVNSGNSGGPLLDFKTGKVAGIVTRAVTGIVENQFQNLLSALRQNQVALSEVSGGVRISGIDPLQAIMASQVAMEQIAKNLHRSANVGIGYAYSAKYSRDNISGYNAPNPHST